MRASGSIFKTGRKAAPQRAGFRDVDRTDGPTMMSTRAAFYERPGLCYSFGVTGEGKYEFPRPFFGPTWRFDYGMSCRDVH